MPARTKSSVLVNGNTKSLGSVVVDIAKTAKAIRTAAANVICGPCVPGALRRAQSLAGGVIALALLRMSAPCRCRSGAAGTAHSGLFFAILNCVIIHFVLLDL